jgi:hypothetical protein
MTDKKCNDVIDAELNSRIDWMHGWINATDQEEFENEEGRPDDCLSIETEIVKRVVYSTGGPHDEFEVHIDPASKEITEVYYVYKDWFDGARRRLNDEQLAIFETIWGDLLTYNME